MISVGITYQSPKTKEMKSDKGDRKCDTEFINLISGENVSTVLSTSCEIHVMKTSWFRM